MNKIVVLCRASFVSVLRRSTAEHNCSAYFVSDLESLRQAPLDDVILVAFSTGVIVPPDVLGRVKEAFNFHPGSSCFPGRDPHYWALYRQAKEFGCTAHFMAEKVDAGAIVASRSFDASRIHTAEKLRLKTEILMFGLFEALLPDILDGSLVPTDERWSGTKRSRKDFIAAGYTFEEPDFSEIPCLDPYDLGNALYFGLHKDQDISAAKIEFENAATQSHPQAQLRLARLKLDEGNAEHALLWAERAITNGNKAASQFLEIQRLA